MSTPESIAEEAERGTRMAEAYPAILALVAEAVTDDVRAMFTLEEVRALLLEGMQEHRAGINQDDQRR